MGLFCVNSPSWVSPGINGTRGGRLEGVCPHSVRRGSMSLDVLLPTQSLELVASTPFVPVVGIRNTEHCVLTLATLHGVQRHRPARPESWMWSIMLATMNWS